MTVRELTQRMDSRELTEWLAYSIVEPFGEDRQDLRAAKTTAALSQAVMNPLSAADLFGWLQEETSAESKTDGETDGEAEQGGCKGQSVEEQKLAAKRICGIFAAIEKRKEQKAQKEKSKGENT